MKLDSRVKLILSLLVVVAIFSVLSLLYWDFIRDAIVTPIYYMIWLGDLTLKSLPQEVYLALLIVLCIIIGLGTLGKVRSRQIVQEGQRSRSTGGTRYLYWKKLCEHLDTSQFARNHFASETRRLILSILAHQEGIDVFEVERMVADGTLSVPDDVRNLITRQEIRSPQNLQTTAENWTTWLRRLILRVDSEPDSQIDQQSDGIIRFIEQRLEITRYGN